MTVPESSGPVAELRRRLGLRSGPVRRIASQNAAGQTSVIEVAADGLSAVRGFPSGVQQWEWVEGDALLISHVPPEHRQAEDILSRLRFDAQGRPIREEAGEKVTAEYHYDGPALISASRYEQISDREMGWVEATYVPHPPEQGGTRREQVSMHYPDGLMSVELREYDALGREIYNESYSNSDDEFHTSRTSYADDERGNWLEMCIQTQSSRPGSEQTYVHRRQIEYWEE